ncbi:MAG: hypothetical protein ASARMPREDX12_009300 [Alectoria sarmentosa]|nr:MAG: hypothetical protein ASARMPREDX12_009300 [Alectoria sarmentosa]
MIIRFLTRYSRAFIPSSTRSAVSSAHPCRQLRPFPSITQPHLRCHFAAKTSADEKVEELQELYATAKDEFEIASEETEKKTVYAADDRAAAEEELANFKEAYEKALKSTDGEQIKNRIGSRVRELERAVESMMERAMED